MHTLAKDVEDRLIPMIAASSLVDRKRLGAIPCRLSSLPKNFYEQLEEVARSINGKSHSKRC